jgi:hypothetical protein
MTRFKQYYIAASDRMNACYDMTDRWSPAARDKGAVNVYSLLKDIPFSSMLSSSASDISRPPAKDGTGRSLIKISLAPGP